MTEWIYGRRSVREHLELAPATCRTLVLARGAKVDAQLAALAQAQGLAVEQRDRRDLDSLATGGNHQGVCLAVGGWTYVELDDLLDNLGGDERLPLLLFLDSVQDPRNLGAVLRVADGVGAVGVVIPKDRAAGLSAAVARTASGALATVPVARVVNMARALDQVKRAGMTVWVASDSGGQDLHAAPVRFPCALVLGGEHQGVRPNVASRGDAQVSIPMAGAIESLNVAVAAGVLCYELRRRFMSPESAAFSLDTP